MPMAMAAALCFAGTANAAVSVNWSCQATVPNFGVQTSSMSTSVTTTAPASVKTGTPATITIAPGSSTVPLHPFPFVTVNNIHDMQMTIEVSNATIDSASASGGTVSGTTAVVGNTVVLSVPASITGGTMYTPPAVTINVTAGAVPGPITSKYAGTSYSSPGMTFTTNLTVPLVGTSDATTSCYPNPSPTLTSTTITT